MKKTKQKNEMIKKSNKTKYIIIGVASTVLVVVVIAVVGTLLFWSKNQSTTSTTTGAIVNSDGKVSTPVILKNFTAEELAKYDGTNPELPIYLALNGDVYDVTPGKKFYEIGGSYHYLAGRDSSEELNQIGGYIIKRKYTVIGKFIQ